MASTKIIVPTCTWQLARNLAHNLAEHTQDYDLIIVHNDDQPMPCYKGAPLSKLLYIAARIGYTSAVNHGYLIAGLRDTDTLVVLNDDVVISGEWLPQMQAALKPGVGQVGPVLRMVGKDGFWGNQSDEYVFVEGWCFAMSGRWAKASWAEAPGFQGKFLFDPAFQNGFCEDMDLSIRIARAGGKIEQVPLPVKHMRSQTYGQAREPFWTRNRQYLAEKWRL